MADRISAKYASIRERRRGINVRPNKLMILCFIFEFLNRWVVQAMDSRLASFMNNKFGFTALSYSFLSCSTGIISCLQQAFLYGYIVRTCGVPIPYLALSGVTIETVGYFLMASSSHVALTIVGSTLLWMGYAFASPTSSSIISTTNAPEVQGKVLSWNNMCQQTSLIICPMVLSAIYSRNIDATYYSCMIVSFLAFIVMCFIIAMPNSKQFGKKNVLELPVQDKASIELKEEVKPSESKNDEASKDVSKLVIDSVAVASAPADTKSTPVTVDSVPQNTESSPVSIVLPSDTDATASAEGI